MADRTAARRVKRYRAVQKAKRGISRVEVQVPSAASPDIRALGAKLRSAYRQAESAGHVVSFILATVNAPRPRRMDAWTLIHCLTTPRFEKQWFPHVEALFDEVSAEAIHDLVLAGIVDFEDLYRAARSWKVTDGRNIPWIKEMADLSLARPAA